MKSMVSAALNIVKQTPITHQLLFQCECIAIHILHIVKSLNNNYCNAMLNEKKSCKRNEHKVAKSVSKISSD